VLIMANESKEQMKRSTEQVAREVASNDPKGQHGNGNNQELPETKRGGAQAGGPGIEKARANQPPDATIARSK
jgi:hypothetical protein